ncbi:MAG: bifunctional homocysteine S-methyltransferase/methylenetetrahydrofolate reductase [Acidobacteriia bacterium]|nr:bifunctional homocysteine S-methyltransferase/methylenetetrahydrofolate reductase [Terriglobia bacterium]
MVKRREFLERLEKEVLLCDGAMGTFLYSRGVPLNERDEQNLTNPDLIRWVHEQYIAAGAQIIQTNTFTSNRLRLRELGMEDRLLEINQSAVRVALEAAGDKVFVAGSVGPLGALVKPYGNLTVDDLGQVYKEQIQILAESGVHLILIETHPSLLEALEAVRAAKAGCELPVVVQMTFWEDGKSKFGDDFRRSLEALAAADADVVGVNCTLGPQEMFDLVNDFVSQSDLKISVQPNAGHPQIIHGKTVFLSSPEYLQEYARAFVNCGVNIIGGCCGTTPEHIRAMASVVQGQSPKPHRRRAVTVHVEVEPVESRRASQVGEVLESPRLLDKVGTKTLATCEINPPKGLDYSKMVEGARLLKEAGVDAVNITDNPMARVRMSSVAMAHILQREVGIEAIWQLTCRDRNVIGIQSDLLGAAALGIRAVLALTGDPITIGDYPKGTAVFEVNSTGLVRIVKGLNNGFDFAGQNIGTTTSYQIGTAASPAADDLQKELARLEEKLEAGADFVQTQPVFEASMAEKFMKRVEHLKVPILFGIMPLRSSRHAEFMHNEVPGITIPDWIRERMKNASEETAAEEGVQIASQIIEDMKGIGAGVHFYPPVNRFDLVVRLVEILNPKAARA